MRVLWMLLVVALAGCVDEAPVAGSSMDAFALDVYIFDDPDADAFFDHHGMMMRVHNPTAATIAYNVSSPGMVAGQFGPVSREGVAPHTTVAADALAPGESRLWLFQSDETRTMHRYEILVESQGGHFEYVRHLTTAGGRPVQPGMHVVTYTVGVWINGTSFYTNVQAFNDDPHFPAGYDRAEFGGDGLPVYVFDAQASEQPVRSRDTCHFTTITGYNELLKGQGEGGSDVRFLRPEEAYTLPGREEFFLYGEPLVFLNRVALIENRDTRFDPLPDPQGGCFDPQNAVNYATERAPLS